MLHVVVFNVCTAGPAFLPLIMCSLLGAKGSERTGSEGIRSRTKCYLSSAGFVFRVYLSARMCHVYMRLLLYVWKRRARGGGGLRLALLSSYYCSRFFPAIIYLRVLYAVVVCVCAPNFGICSLRFSMFLPLSRRAHTTFRLRFKF